MERKRAVEWKDRLIEGPFIEAKGLFMDGELRDPQEGSEGLHLPLCHPILEHV